MKLEAVLATLVVSFLVLMGCTGVGFAMADWGGYFVGIRAMAILLGIASMIVVFISGSVFLEHLTQGETFGCRRCDELRQEVSTLRDALISEKP